MIRSLHRLGQGIASRTRNMLYRLLGVRIRKYCWLRNIEISRNWSDITLHGCAIDRGSVLLCSGEPKADKIEIGHGTYINRYTTLDAHEKITIGRDVMIGPYCFITDGEHGFIQGASVKSQPMTTKPVIIEDEAWLGARVTVLSGVRIGRGAVIGAGSLVTKDVPADAIAYGSPATVRSHRKPAPAAKN